jgi:hypothetical protein
MFALVDSDQFILWQGVRVPIPRKSVRWCLWVWIVATLFLSGCQTQRELAQIEGCPQGPVAKDSAQLKQALKDAGPGSVIVLAPGRYEGRFVVDSHGTEAEPAWLCGPRDAELRLAEVDRGYVLHVDGASHWHLRGFSIRGGLKSLMLDGANNNNLTDIAVGGAGHEAVHVRTGSSGNAFTRISVDGAGLHEPDFGEGIYVGSAQSNWCDVSACEADRSDNNRFVDISVRGTTAEPIDIKEGTSRGRIIGARLDSSAMTHGSSYIDVKGSRWQVSNVRGTGGADMGLAIYRITGESGRRNSVASNTFEVPVADSAVVVSKSAHGLGNRVACDNSARVGGRSISMAAAGQPCDAAIG